MQARALTPLAVAHHLAARYGYSPAIDLDRLRARIATTLSAFATRLDGSRDYLDGDRPNALDAYVATFLTSLCPIPESDCPRLQPLLRQAFGTAREEIGDAVPRALFDHRSRRYERHLGWPIEI